MAILMFWSIYSIYKVEIAPCHYIMSRIYDLTVRNQDKFFLLNTKFRFNSKFQHKRFLKSPNLLFFDFKKIYFLIKNSEIANFAHFRLQHYPSISQHLRIRLIFCTICYDYINGLVKIAYLTGLSLLVLSYTFVILAKYTLRWTIFILSDMILILYLLWSTIQSAILLLYCLVVFAFFARQHFNDLSNRYLRITAAIPKRRHSINQQTNDRINLYQNVIRYQYEHIRYQNECHQFNKLLISKLLLVAIVTNIPFNIYLIIVVSVKRLDFFNRLFICMILAIQFIILILASIPLLSISRYIYPGFFSL